MKKALQAATAIAFLLCIILAPVLTKLEKNTNTSYYENRTLAKVPEFSPESLFGGTYFPQWEKYLSDHFWKREDILKAYTNLSMKLQKTVVNNVVISPDILLPYINERPIRGSIEADSARMAEGLALARDAAEEVGARFLYVGVPDQHSMLIDNYPEGLFNDEAELEMIEASFFKALDSKGIENLNIKALYESEEENFMKFFPLTDHHYNLIGAHYTYQAILEKLGLTPLSIEEFGFFEVPNPFLGSRNRRLFGLHGAGERLLAHSLSIPFERSNGKNKSESTLFTYPPNPDENVTYLMYMGGDFWETQIKTNRPYLEDILLIGDSFTNALETLLYASFNTMTSVDFRYYKDMPPTEYIRSIKPDYVILLRDDTAYLSFDGNGNIA